MHAFKHLIPKHLALAALMGAAPMVSFTATAPAFAQAQQQGDLTGRISKLEQDVQRLQKQGGIKPGSAAEISLESNSELTQRVLALEHLVEQLTGQIEELRFNTDRNGKQMATLQDDVSLRLARIEQSLGLAGGAPAPQQQGQAAPAPGENMSEPLAQEPKVAAGSQQAAQAAAGNGPPDGVSNNGGFVIRTDAKGRALPPDPNQPQTPPPAAPLPTAQQAAPKAAPGPGPVSSGQIASAGAAHVTMPDGTPKQQYEFAFDYLKKQDYPRAESALRQFLQAHPKDPLAGNAQYWLGETYYVRGDFQQAAVEFMAGYTKYPKTNKGPDNLLKLGMAMSKLNQKDGACTALSRINKDYPDAPDTVIKQGQAERAKLKCK